MLGFEIKVRIGVLPEGKDMGKWWKMDAVAANFICWYLMMTTENYHFNPFQTSTDPTYKPDVNIFLKPK